MLLSLLPPLCARVGAFPVQDRLGSSAASLFLQVVHAHRDGFHLDTERAATLFLQIHPGNVYAYKIHLYRGIARYHLGRLKDAESDLSPVLALLPSGDGVEPLLWGQAAFCLAGIRRGQGRAVEAGRLFLAAAEFLGGEPLAAALQVSSLVEGAESLIIGGQVSSALPVLEYLMGRRLEGASGRRVRGLLLEGYGDSGLHPKVLEVYRQMDAVDFDSARGHRQLVQVARSHEALSGTLDDDDDGRRDMLETAYQLYCRVVASAEGDVSEVALSGAWNIAAGLGGREFLERGQALLGLGERQLQGNPLLAARFRGQLALAALDAGGYELARRELQLAVESLWQEAHPTPEGKELASMLQSYLVETDFLLGADLPAMEGRHLGEVAAQAYSRLLSCRESYLQALGHLSQKASVGGGMELFLSGQLARYAALAGNLEQAVLHGQALWQAVESLFGGGPVPLEATQGEATGDWVGRATLTGYFWTGWSLFQLGRYGEAVSWLAVVLDFWDAFPLGGGIGPAAANLHALSLFRCHRQQEGLAAFSLAHGRGWLDAGGILNYALAAFQCGRLDDAIILAEEAAGRGLDAASGSFPLPEKAAVPSDDFVARCHYVAASAAFALGDWGQAEASFGAGLSSLQDGQDTGGLYHRYYLAVSQFRQGRLEDAWTTLNRAGSLLQEHPLAETAARLAIHCCLQLYQQTGLRRWWEQAAAVARNLVEAADDFRQQQRMWLLAAGIHNDGGDYDGALAMVEPYLDLEDGLSLGCRFLAAGILTSLGRLEEAVHHYGQLAGLAAKVGLREGSAEVVRLGEISAYRKGTLLYAMGDYLSASETFSAYCREHTAGIYHDAALYFNGEALARAGLVDRAILQYEGLLVQHPASPFAFSSLAGLLRLYRDKGEYAVALEKGRALLALFPQEAQAAGVASQLEELRLLEQGVVEGVAVTLAAYRQWGEHWSPEGRRLGVELAARLLAQPGGEEDSERLLTLLLEFCGEDEGQVSAKASYLLADLYRSQNRYGEAARLFLEAARRYGGYNHEAVALSLYRGAESFDMAGMRADSKAVAAKLAVDFPQSDWSEAARIFLVE